MSYRPWMKPWNKNEQWVPFTHKKHHQMHYPDQHGDSEGEWDDATMSWTKPNTWALPVWEKNSVFEDTLTFVDYCRGRSAAYFEMQRTNGQLVTVFMSDFAKTIVPHMVNGVVTGKFTFVKQGQNYGCKRVE